MYINGGIELEEDEESLVGETRKRLNQVEMELEDLRSRKQYSPGFYNSELRQIVASNGLPVRRRNLHKPTSIFATLA